jgi:hypothetical protein
MVTNSIPIDVLDVPKECTNPNHPPNISQSVPDTCPADWLNDIVNNLDDNIDLLSACVSYFCDDE